MRFIPFIDLRCFFFLFFTKLILALRVWSFRTEGIQSVTVASLFHLVNQPCIFHQFDLIMPGLLHWLYYFRFF